MIHDVFHRIVVASLMVGLGGAGASPALVAASACRHQRADAPVHPTCCCQGACKGHCGMACCRPAAPVDDPLPPPPRSSQEIVPMLGIAAASAMPIDPTVYSGLQRKVSCDDVGPSARNSLLTLSIRINI